MYTVFWQIESLLPRYHLSTKEALNLLFGSKWKTLYSIPWNASYMMLVRWVEIWFSALNKPCPRYRFTHQYIWVLIVCNQQLTYLWYSGDMVTYTDSRMNTKHERIASWDKCQFRTADPEYQIIIPPPSDAASMLAIRPWPIHQKCIGITWAVKRTGRNSESFMDRNDSPLDCLHLALASRYHSYGGDMRTRFRSQAAR